MSRLLNLVGLVTARRHRVMAAQLRDAESRAKKLTKLVDQSRADTRTWKTKAHDATQHLKAVEKDAAHQAQRAEKQAAHQAQRAEKHRLEVEKLEANIDRIRREGVDLEALRKRLADAEHELAIAREHLMAVEVKLDILEGAANVLDGRTRSVIAQQAGETGAPA